MKAKLFFSSLGFLTIFTLFSYSVAKELFQKIDFDTTVKLQDRIPRRFDGIFSYFSLLGSAEVTVGFCLILSFLFLLKGKWLGTLGWLMIIPASLAEVFGKLILYHPAPPVLFHRSTLPTHLPSFYIHTDFSYPSGHMTRTAFIVTVIILLLAMQKNFLSKSILLFLLFSLAGMMALTRIYLGEHWLSDVLGGGLLGISFGLFASVLILPKHRVLSNL